MILYTHWQEALGLIGIASILGYTVLLLGKYGLASTRLSQRESPSAASLSVTVMQPLLSGDPQLESMLTANLENTQAEVQFLWLIDSTDQVAQQLASRLASGIGDRVSILLCEPAPADWNPKTYKLSLGLAQVATKYVAVLDDDTVLANNNLESAVNELQFIDLYTGLPVFHSSPGVGSQLVTHFVNNNSLMTYLAVAQLVPPLTINGMFYVSRTEYLRGIRAFEAIHGQLCDDLALAQLIIAAGGKIHQGVTPVHLKVTIKSLSHYQSVMHRWFVFADILIHQQPLKTKLVLALLLGFPPVLLWGSLLSLFWGGGSIVVFAIFITFRFAVLRRLLTDASTSKLPLNIFWSVVSELLQPLHFVHAKLQSHIQWRCHRIKVHRNGAFLYCAARKR